jgi:hypothetical protein
LRLRVVAIAAVAGLTYFATEHRSELPAAPDPGALILNLRNQFTPFRFTVGTYPESPNCDTPITLKVHVIDAAGYPVDGLIVEAAASVTGVDHGAQYVTLRGKGHGNYEGRIKLELAGSWQVDLTGTTAFKTSRQRFSIDVGAAHGSSEPNEDDSES